MPLLTNTNSNLHKSNIDQPIDEINTMNDKHFSKSISSGTPTAEQLAFSKLKSEIENNRFAEYAVVPIASGFLFGRDSHEDELVMFFNILNCFEILF